MDELPSGTVTFLFTDIEGSTRLLKELGRNRYATVLGEHERLLRAAFAAHQGRVVDTQGDALFVAFRTAVDAQRDLAAENWTDGVDVKVRMGLHTGEPRVGEQRYVGIGVHRAARIAAAGHGGQVSGRSRHIKTMFPAPNSVPSCPWNSCRSSVGAYIASIELSVMPRPGNSSATTKNALMLVVELVPSIPGWFEQHRVRIMCRE